MKVRITFDLTDSICEAINGRYGRSGMATRDQCVSCIKSLVDADLDQIESDYILDSIAREQNSNEE